MADLRAKYLHKLAKRNAEARKIKAQLMLKRGNKCEWPGCDARTNLTFDHRYGRDYALESMNQLTRLRRYVQEEREGKIRLLCATHNCSLGAIERNKGFRADYGEALRIKRQKEKLKRVQEFLRS